jgi:organic radical activating enzyme
MKHTKPKRDNSFCLMPFYHIATAPFGKYKLCCEATVEPYSQEDMTYKEWWTSKELNEIREKLSRGEKHSSCQTCYRIEEAGGTSRRLRPNLLVDQNNINFENPKLKSIDLRMGNLCNAMCISCRPEYSSLLEKEYKVLFKDYSGFKNIKKISEDRLFDIPDSYINGLESVYVSGGEPSLSRQILNFVKKLNSNCHLTFNTNMRIINKEFWAEMKRFETISVGPSCDGVDESFNFSRYPIKFNNFNKNLDWLIENFPNAYIFFNFTYSILNFDQVKNVYFLALKKKQHHKNFSLTYNILTTPPKLCVNTFPKEKRVQLSADIHDFINKNENGLIELQALETLRNMEKFLINDELPEKSLQRLQVKGKDFIHKISAHRNVAIPGPINLYLESIDSKQSLHVT